MSVFLYVAIVAIWIFVLVPRWLRRPHEMSAANSELTGTDRDDEEYDDYGSESADAGQDSATNGPDGGTEAGSPPRYGGPRHGSDPRVRQVPQPRRSRVLQARRRLLTILVLLMAAAGTLVGLKLTAWWACVPPAGMLGVYLLLLREAGLADADQARRRAVMNMQVQAARQRAHEIALVEEEQYSAQIIDISARIGDQLYDQYADATVRAVGD